MRTDKSVGRLAGGLLLIQMAILTAGFIVLKPGVAAEYLPAAAVADAGVRTGVLLLLAGGAITLVISAIVYPLFREYSLRLTVVLAAVAVVWVVMQAIDGVHVHSMLALSKRYLADGGANADLYNLLAAEVRSTRGAAHYTVLLAIDIWFAVLYGMLFRFRLVPRVLAGGGLVAVALHIIGIPMSMFIGYGIIWPVAYGIAISYLLNGGWLIAKGFPLRT